MTLKLATFALAVLLSASARAQPKPPTLSWFGVADVNVSAQNSGYGWHPAIGSGGGLASRIGFKGEMQFTDALSAVYLGEAGLAFSTGVEANGATANGVNNTAVSSGGFTGNGPQIFSRQMFAGLKSPVGTLTVGRQYTASYLIAAITASPNPGLYGYAATLIALNGMPTRLNNSAAYTSPKVGGLYLYALGSTGNLNDPLICEGQVLEIRDRGDHAAAS